MRMTTIMKRACLAAIYQIARDSQGGYHPDTNSDDVDDPSWKTTNEGLLSKAIYDLIHLFLGMSKVSIADELVEQGQWVVIRSMKRDTWKRPEIHVVDLVFSYREAIDAMLEDRRELISSIQVEPNEGDATVRDGRDAYCSATDPDGLGVEWNIYQVKIWEIA